MSLYLIVFAVFFVGGYLTWKIGWWLIDFVVGEVASAGRRRLRRDEDECRRRLQDQP